jgi:two-component system, cell cycle sensor histidine kinase and response regulator CckA
VTQPTGRSPSEVRKTILIVEDERAIAKDLKRTLESFGYEVLAMASTADDAIRLVSERCPDLALMDIRIQGERDGIEAAEILRLRFGVPVIYLTAFVDAETLARAKTTEPLGYLLKPVRPDELRSAVEIALHRHEAERGLRAREHLLATTLRSIGEGIVSTDIAGRITFMNPVAESLTGRRTEAVRGRPLGEVLRAAGPGPVDLITRALRERKPVQLDAALVAPGGLDTLVADKAAPIVDDTGVVLGAVLVFRDVGEQRRQQRQVELDDRLASLGTMAAGVAHHVNNPLGYVVGNLEFALDHLRRHREVLASVPGMGDMSDALAEAQLGAEQVARVVAQLRRFAGPVKGGAGRIDINKIVKWSMDTMGPELSARARLVADLSPVAEVIGDENRLGQVLVNLLMNAAQAGSPEQPPHEVRVATGVDGSGGVFIEVRDGGCGMSADVMKRIFDPFFTTRAGQGAGLGLAVCHGIVSSLGGAIAVDSEPGKGSRFRITLPAAPPAVAEAAQ